MRNLARLLDADWLVLSTLHDATARGGVPRLSLSARAYAGSTGELLWVAFEAGSGIDHRGAFELGTLHDLRDLAPRVVERLARELVAGATTGRPSPSTPSAAQGMWAVVPFDSSTEKHRTANAETVTETARAALFRDGVALVAPGCVNEVLRRGQSGQWGGVSRETRAGLRESCSADRIVTGSVARYDVGGVLDDPQPRVTIDLRMVDPERGHLVWADLSDARGWQHEKLFRAGRIYTRGGLAERMTRDLTRHLLADRSREAARSAEAR
jgi:TolB-like protein